MKQMIHYMMLIMVAVLVSSCSQSPNERKAQSGEKTCVAISDVLSIGSEKILSVDPQRPDIGVTTWAVERVETLMSVATKRIYEAMANNSQWRDIINTLIALMIVFYALGVMTGVTQPSGYVLVINALKIGFVWALATQWDVFYDLVINNVESLIRLLAGTMANAFADGVYIPSIYNAAAQQEDNLFHYVDQVITMLFSSGYWRLVFATFTSGWSGSIYGILMLFMVGSYMFAVIDTLKIYLVALITRMLLYAMAPFFIVFLLFKQTKSLFDGWVEQLISFSLQPIFAMAFIGMFQMIYMGFLAGLVPAVHADQKVCYDTVATFSGGIPFGYGDVFGDGSPGAPKISGIDAELPFNIWVILILLMISSLMVSMVSWSVDVATRISGGFLSAMQVPIEGWSQVKAGATGKVREAFGLASANVDGKSSIYGHGGHEILQSRQQG